MNAEAFHPLPGAAFTVRARWIFPVAGPPLDGGAVEMGADGRVQAVHRHPPGDAHDLGDVAIVPGLINAHTHLEFSELTEPLRPARPFAKWLRAVVDYRKRRGDAGPAIRKGLAESARSGTIAVGEIDTRGDPAQYSPEGPKRVVAFRELLGLSSEAVAQQKQIGEQFLGKYRSGDLPAIVRGLSPHAPYSVHPRLLDHAVSMAMRWQSPMAIHLAETRAELECLASGTGEIVDLLTESGIWQGPLYPRGTRPLDFLRRLEPLPRVVVAHGNYLNDEELDFLACHPNFTLVYCPRTHAFFGHEDHPWQKLAARGGAVAIGTDGRCSNPDLSIWHELQDLRRRFPESDAAELLRMGTVNGARALGLHERFGTIEPGKSPGLAVIRIGRVGSADPYVELFDDDSNVVDLIAT